MRLVCELVGVLDKPNGWNGAGDMMRRFAGYSPVIPDCMVNCLWFSRRLLLRCFGGERGSSQIEGRADDSVPLHFPFWSGPYIASSRTLAKYACKLGTKFIGILYAWCLLQF